MDYLLEEANICSLIKDNQEFGRLAGFAPSGNSVELYVYNSDIKKSKIILDNFIKYISQ